MLDNSHIYYYYYIIIIKWLFILNIFLQYIINITLQKYS